MRGFFFGLCLPLPTPRAPPPLPWRIIILEIDFTTFNECLSNACMHARAEISIFGLAFQIIMGFDLVSFDTFFSSSFLLSFSMGNCIRLNWNLE